MTENSWSDLGTFRADNIHTWQVFDTSQYWIRYLKIVIKDTYTTTGTYFLTLSNIRYL
jgi:hypothetical protein